MSYIVIKLYSYACDMPDCPVTEDIAPEATAPAAKKLADEGRRLLIESGWAIVRGRPDEHICPQHPDHPAHKALEVSLAAARRWNGNRAAMGTAR